MNYEDWATTLSWAALMVPVALALINALIRSIVKGIHFFSWENLYMGIDLSFASLASTGVETILLLREYAMDLARQPHVPEIAKLSPHGMVDFHFFTRVASLFALCLGCGMALLVTTKLHQNYDCPARVPDRTNMQNRNLLEKQHRRDQVVWLGLASNSVGFSVFVVFAWMRFRHYV